VSGQIVLLTKLLDQICGTNFKIEQAILSHGRGRPRLHIQVGGGMGALARTDFIPSSSFLDGI